MESLSPFQDLVLRSLVDDMEAPHTIAPDLARDLGRRVDESEVGEALAQLINLGLVSPVVYRQSTERFEGPTPNEMSTGDVWYRITSAG